MSIDLTARLAPSGHISVLTADLAGGGARGAARIAAAFEAGNGEGLLHLGAAEVETALDPTLAFWRELGQEFVRSVCSTLNPMKPDEVRIPEPDPAALQALVSAVPPMRGGEVVSVDLLERLWEELGQTLQARAAETEGGVQAFLEARHSLWNTAGRVCLHLAENKRNPELPFAFIATYARHRAGTSDLHYVPLSHALREYKGAGNKQKLLALLTPLKRAAEESEEIRAMVDSGEIYHPMAWSAAEAYSFLQETERFERAGLVLRLPNWWSAARRPRPVVSVTLGDEEPSHLGLAGLLDFDVRVSLGGEALSKEELAALLQSTPGLILVKGQWVEVDPERLSQVMDQWSEVQAQAAEGGVSFVDAMRMLSGTDAPGDVDAESLDWSEVTAGRWLAGQFDALRSPEVMDRIDRGAGLDGSLRPYQKQGVQWLWTLHGLGLGGCLADDMGLGKTIQVIALLNMLHGENGDAASDLLVVPASLLENWRSELHRFAPELRPMIAHASRISSPRLKGLTEGDLQGHDLVITTYGTAARTPWIQDRSWRCVILDEAQAIKNPGARQTRAVKKLTAAWRLALTGTPVENRLGDLWSIFDFLNPGLLGSAKAFGGRCKAMSKDLRDGFGPLRRLVAPYILRRLKTDKRVISDLPDKTEVTAHCLLSKTQAALYKDSVLDLKERLADVDGMQRRGLVLSFLMRFKQICNHPSQWLGDGAFEASQSGKFQRLTELCEPIAARQEKALVFTQFRAMTEPLRRHLETCFGRPGLVLHGGTAVRQRQQLVERFQTDDDVPFMVLSLKAGGTGLNLTAARHVIHFDRWWNPAVENQATDRAFRIGQRSNVLVHKFVCKGTVEERIDQLIQDKTQLSEEVLSQGAEAKLTELTNDELMAMVQLDLKSAVTT